MEAGLDEAAAEALRRSVQLQDSVEARYLLGLACSRLGWRDEAQESYQAAAALRPSLVQARIGMAFLELERGDLAGGLSDCAAILDERPEIQEVRQARGLVQETAGRFGDAAETFAGAIAISPADASAHRGLARVMLALGRPAEALASASEAARLAPDDHEARGLIGKALYRLGRYAESVDAYVNAIARHPDGLIDDTSGGQSELVNQYDGLACALRQLNRCEEIVFWCRRALERVSSPASKQLLWWRVFDACLAAGDYELAWNAYARFRPGNGRDRRALTGPVWTGERLDGGVLLVHADHGLEHTVPFLRLLQAAKARSGAQLLLECEPDLAPLVARCPGADRIIPRSSLRQSPGAHYDAHCSLLDLAGLLGVTVSGLTAAEPCLAPPEEEEARWRAYLGGRPGLKVGLYLPSESAAGNPRRPSLDDLAQALRSLPGVALIDLRAEQASIDGAASDPSSPSPRLKSVELAAACAALGILICGDGPAVHLAGAQGVNTWALAPSSPSWIWTREGTTSPWYPSVRLFREDPSAGWASVVRRIVESIRSIAAGHPA